MYRFKETNMGRRPSIFMRVDHRRAYRGIRWKEEHHTPLIKAINYQNQNHLTQLYPGEQLLLPPLCGSAQYIW